MPQVYFVLVLRVEVPLLVVQNIESAEEQVHHLDGHLFIACPQCLHLGLELYVREEVEIRYATKGRS